jgi:hypothetical protein
MASSRSSRAGRRRGNAELHPDNTFGRGGYYPLPAKLAGLGTYVINLAPKRLVSHKVFLERVPWGGGRRGDRPIHMLTARVDHHFSIMVEDMKSLIKHGLIRMQSNEPGTMAFYFEG